MTDIIENVKDFLLFFYTPSNSEETNIIRKFSTYTFALSGMIIIIQFIIIIFLFAFIIFEPKNALIQIILLFGLIWYFTKKYFNIALIEIYYSIEDYFRYKISLTQEKIQFINSLLNTPS
jgi:hypothetical protein